MGTADEKSINRFPLVVSYYTRDEIYEPAGKRLISSLARLGLEHYVEVIDRFGDYSDHCFMKAPFLKRMLETHRRPVFWTDADNEFIKYPSLLGELDCDIALARFFRWDHELSSTVIYLNDTPVIHALLDSWDRTNRVNPKQWTADQINLHKVVQDYIGLNMIRVGLLPWSYYQSVDSEVKEDPVIWQHQASREGRTYAVSPS